jgi:hypothetical protein
MASEHATAVREREESIAATAAAVIAARSAVVTARLAVEPLLRKLREAEAAARQAELDSEHAVMIGNQRARESLSADERYALHAWSLDVTAAHDEARNQPTGVNQPMSARRKKRIEELREASQAVAALELAADPLTEIASLRQRLRVPAHAWVRDQPGDPPPPAEADVREERSPALELVAAID